MKNFYGLVVLALGLIFGNDVALAHAKLRTTTVDNQIPKLVPRSASDANKGGLTEADLPCGRGSTVRSATPVVLTAGDTVTIEIEETVNHNGRYEVNFSLDGQAGFIENNLLTIIDDIAGAPNLANPNRYSDDFIVPATPCTNCVLQMVQVMVAGAAETYYKSCVDIVITPAAAPPPIKPTGLTVQAN